MQSEIGSRSTALPAGAISRLNAGFFSVRARRGEGLQLKENTGSYALTVLLLLLSGVTALVYQVLWIKQIALIVGIDIYAVTTVVSAFFAGLGAGSVLIGRHADRSTNPLRLYAVLELGIALLAIFTVLILARIAPLFASLQAQIGQFAFLLLFLLVGLPAMLMGGVLPVLCRVCAPTRERIGRTGGGLYASNTLGAVGGALLTPFLLIPVFGIAGSAFAAATVNLVLAVVAFAWSIINKPIIISPKAKPMSATPSSLRTRALALYAIAGGIALGYEVVWSQVVVQFMSTRSFAFAIMLATYLVGIALGSAIHARFADRIRNPWKVFALLIAGAGACALLQIALLGNWLPQWQSQAAAIATAISDQPLLAMSARFFVASAAIVLVPCLLLGAAFPVALRLIAGGDTPGRDTGIVIAANTFGGILGTVVSGFVLVPLFGLVHTLDILALLALSIGAVALITAGANRPRRHFTPAHGLFSAVAVTVLLLVALTPGDRFALLLRDARGGDLVAYQESAGGTVAVLQQGGERQKFNRLYIQGVSNSGDAMPSRRYMRLQALLPLLIQADEPRSALVIALGTGITAGALTQYPGLQQRVSVELLPAVASAATQFRGNYNVIHSPDVELRFRDGRNELLRNPQRYDLITLEPPPPSAASVVNLYSRDFYQLAKSRLQPSGLFAQWLPLATQNNEDTRALVRSFLDVFPHASLWTTELHEMLLVGSTQPFTLDAERISRRFSQPSVAAALSEVGISSAAALVATWVTGTEGLEQYAGDIAAVTDDRPSIEYAKWLRPGEFTRVLPQLLSLRSDPPLQVGTEQTSTEFSAQVAAERENLLRFYGAGIHAYRGERREWAQLMGMVLEQDGSNMYYQWFAGGG